VIREAQVPLGSAVYSLRAWAYARAVAPTLNTTSPIPPPPPRGPGSRHIHGEDASAARAGAAQRTSPRSAFLV
jgi:hypothetical protein